MPNFWKFDLFNKTEKCLFVCELTKMWFYLVLESKREREIKLMNPNMHIKQN